MVVNYQEKERIFTINMNHASYQMKIDGYGFLLHLYYGAKAKGSMEHLLTYADRGFSGNPYDAGTDRTYSMDALPQEYPVQGTRDYRTPCLVVENADGSHSCDLRYKSREISWGKYGLPGLPAMYAGENEAEALAVTLEGRASGLTVTLLYGVFPQRDIVTRTVRVERHDNVEVILERVQSACLDFPHGDYDMIQFYGRYAMERNFQRTSVAHGTQVVGSCRGMSSHQYNPFLIPAERSASEGAGGCYDLSFVYSGEFKAEMEQDQYEQVRMAMGLQGERFSYELKPGDIFYGPEIVLSFSEDGLGSLSRNYHHGFRNHLCRDKYRNIPRPVLLNSWEATYLGFTGEKILEIAKQASELGVEMLVLDDGWFGKRDTDDSGLGDWVVNEKKLGKPLAKLVEEVNELGMKFGIWVESEMVSEDSDFYRAHPDWAPAIPGRQPVRSRNQLVLDFSRPEVVDYISEQLCMVLDKTNIEYLKWDTNRSISDVYSAIWQDQGEVRYRYALGLYDFLERLVTRYPDMLIEGCSGEDDRFSVGMLYYTPQIWCSDNTDAIDRLRIQYETSFGYPMSAVGSHVSAASNHQTGRYTPMKIRGVAAMTGSFGYELDLNKITEEEKTCVREQIQEYHKYWNLIHNGKYYRLTSPFGDEVAAWLFVAKNQDEALLNVVKLETHGNPVTGYVRLKGLDKKTMYRDGEMGRIYPGAGLICGGILVPASEGKYQAWQMHLVKVRQQGGPEIAGYGRYGGK